MATVFQKTGKCLFVAWFLAATSVAVAQDQSLDTIIATVDSEAITESQIRLQVALSRYEARQEGRNPPPAPQLRESALDSIINLKIQTQFANRRNITVAPQAVDEAISSIVSGRDLTADQLKDELERSEVEFEFYRNVVHDRLVVNRIVNEVIAPTISIEESAIDGFLKKYAHELEPVDEYSLSVIVFNMASGISTQQKNEHRLAIEKVVADLRRGIDFQEMRRIVSQYDGVETGDLDWSRLNNLNPVIADAVVGLQPQAYAGPLDGGNAYFVVRLNDVRRLAGFSVKPSRMYHLRQILLASKGAARADETKDRLNMLRNQILAGSDFAELARLHTENPDYRESGGDLGWIPAEQLPREFVTMFEGMEAGEISPVVEYDQRYFIFQLVSRRMSNFDEDKRKFVVNQLRNRKLNQAHRDWVASLRDNSAVEFRTRL